MSDKRFGNKVARVVVECAACGKKMERRETDVARNKTGRFFCSNKCAYKTGQGMKPRRKSDATCLTCGKVFYPRCGGPNMYCSRECHNIAQTLRETRTCERCGAQFEYRPSQSYRRFCSQECAGRALWQRPQERMHNGKPVLLTETGYVQVWEPSRPPRRRWALEHRLVAEEMIGRKLRTDEHVHHINGDRTDNRSENLLVVGSSEHTTITRNTTQERIMRDRNELERYRALYGPLPPE